MLSQGLFTSAYTKLLYEINKAGGVPCEKYPNLWFPEDFEDPEVRHQATVVAKGFCYECPIKTQCFEYALETRQKHGIWGGTSPDER